MCFECFCAKPGALINALEGIWRKMVAIQPAGPELFEPSAFDCDDRLTRPQKLLDISTRGLGSGIKSHARAFTRNEVVTKTIRINGPNNLHLAAEAQNLTPISDMVVFAVRSRVNSWNE